MTTVFEEIISILSSGAYGTAFFGGCAVFLIIGAVGLYCFFAIPENGDVSLTIAVLSILAGLIWPIFGIVSNSKNVNAHEKAKKLYAELEGRRNWKRDAGAEKILSLTYEWNNEFNEKVKNASKKITENIPLNIKLSEKDAGTFAKIYVAKKENVPLFGKEAVRISEEETKNICEKVIEVKNCLEHIEIRTGYNSIDD